MIDKPDGTATKTGDQRTASLGQLMPPALLEARGLDQLRWQKAQSLADGRDAVPRHFQDRPGDIYLCLCMTNELGIKSMVAVRSMAVVNGRVVLGGTSCSGSCASGRGTW